MPQIPVGASFLAVVVRLNRQHPFRADLRCRRRCDRRKASAKLVLQDAPGDNVPGRSREREQPQRGQQKRRQQLKLQGTGKAQRESCSKASDRVSTATSDIFLGSSLREQALGRTIWRNPIFSASQRRSSI